MKIWASYDVYLDREDGDDWPDIWSAGEERWMRPHKLSLTIRQKADEAEPRLVRAWASCQKRWANSQRLTSMNTWYSVTIWEVDGPVPEWLASYVNEAMNRISAVWMEA